MVAAMVLLYTLVVTTCYSALYDEARGPRNTRYTPPVDLQRQVQRHSIASDRPTRITVGTSDGMRNKGTKGTKRKAFG